MREKKPALVIAFETTSQTLAAEALFTSSGLPGRVIPLPSCISAGCGLAWKAEPEQQEMLCAALGMAKLNHKECFVLEMF